MIVDNEITTNVKFNGTFAETDAQSIVDIAETLLEDKGFHTGTIILTRVSANQYTAGRSPLTDSVVFTYNHLGEVNENGNSKTLYE